MTSIAALWRRLDIAGHDACRLEQNEDGWRLSGMAVFRHGDGAAQLIYEAGCDRAWRSRVGLVHGWLDTHPVAFEVSRTAEGVWTLNGELVPGLEGCVDLDYGFTPATNVFQIRRLALTAGQTADAPAAWLDISAGTLVVLPQRYERRSESTYSYSAPSVPYAADLEITAAGFVRQYPGLWELEE